MITGRRLTSALCPSWLRESWPEADRLSYSKPPRTNVPVSMIRPTDVSPWRPWTFFFFFYQSTALSSHAVDGHQMYFGGSVVGKASTIGIEIWLTPSLILTRGQKVLNLASLSTSLNSEPIAFENTARYPNAETNCLCTNSDTLSVGDIKPPRCKCCDGKSISLSQGVTWTH